MKKTQICLRGHDKDILGRTKDGGCKECKNFNDEKYRKEHDMSLTFKTQFCPHGHDTFVTGRSKGGNCLKCSLERNREAYYDHIEETKAKNTAWAIANPEKVKKIKDRWKRLNPMKMKNIKLRQRNGITLEYYDKLFKKQHGKCAICKVHRSKFDRAFAVDHDHNCCPGKKSCGKCIRGLLCFPCNTKLGIVENKLFMRSATRYLKKR
jgi:hypothetical protein